MKEKDDAIGEILDDQVLLFKHCTDMEERMDKVDWKKVENAENIADKFK